MAQNYNLTQTGEQVQQLLNQVTPNTQDIVVLKEGVAARPTTEQVTQMVVTALQNYSTTAEMQQAITDAVVSALGNYSTTTEMNTAITAAITSALANYSTTAQMNTAIATAVAQALVNYYTKSETDAKVSAEAGRAQSVEGNLQQLIISVQQSLVNYYLKTETYSKTEVNALVAAIKQFQYQVVATLPETPGPDTMYIVYLVPSTDPKTQNVKDEFITVLEGSTYKWEQIGSTAVDLSGYSTTAEMNAAIAQALTAYYTKAQVDSALAGKQNVLTFDNTPTTGSTNPVTSGGVKGAIDTESARAAAAEQGLQDEYDSLYALYEAASFGEVVPVAYNDWPLATLEEGKVYRVANSATPTAYSDYMYDDTNTILMATFSFPGIDNVPTAGSENLVKSGGVQNELALGAVYDVSAKNPTAGPNNNGKWESLSALLSDANLNTIISTAVRKGGMSIKFVQSSDNKYVQYRLMADSFSTNEADWQGVDNEITLGSKNLTESSAVYKALLPLKQLTDLTKNWGYKFTLGGTSNGIVTLKTPVVLSQDGDSFEMEVSTSSISGTQYLTFSNSGLPNHAYALAFNATYIGLRDATGVDGNWLVVAKAHGQNPVNGRFTVKIEYADSKIYLYVNNVLVSTVDSQSTVQIGSFGNGGAGAYGYWSGEIYSVKWNGNDIDLMNDSIISAGVDISMTDSILLAIDNEGYPKGFLYYHDEIFYFYSRYENTPYYVRYTIQKNNDTSDLGYNVLWHLKKAKLFKFTADGFVDLNKELVDDAESEFVIHEKGKSDFTGGYHGDERIDIDPSSFVRFFADGKAVSPNDNGGSDFAMECEEFCYMESSSMHETSDVAGEYVPGHPIIAYHFKKNTFKNGGYHVENMIQFTGEHIIDKLFAGICCVDKDAATSVYLPDNILLEYLNGSNDTYDASDIHATKVEMWHPSNKLRVTVDSRFIEGITDDETGRPVYIWDRNVDTKYYHALETQKTFNEGETVRAEMKVEFFIGEQNN